MTEVKYMKWPNSSKKEKQLLIFFSSVLLPFSANHEPVHCFHQLYKHSIKQVQSIDPIGKPRSKNLKSIFHTSGNGLDEFVGVVPFSCFYYYYYWIKSESMISDLYEMHRLTNMESVTVMNCIQNVGYALN